MCSMEDTLIVNHPQKNTDSVPALSLAVSVAPHRLDHSTAGAVEQLVCCHRPFTVHAKLFDASGEAVGKSQDHLVQFRVTLVYADDGSPVSHTNGEPPLTGELAPKPPLDGEASFRVRTAALSYHHGKRAFAVRVDAEPVYTLSTLSTASPSFACSTPLLSRARLPDQSAKPFAAATATDGPQFHTRRPPALPIVEEADLVDLTADTVERRAASNCPYYHQSPDSPQSLIHVLNEQSETLRAALAEQRQLLGEFVKLKGGRASYDEHLMQTHLMCG